MTINRYTPRLLVGGEGVRDAPLLNGYTGPQLISLSSLEENLKILQKEMTL